MNENDLLRMAQQGDKDAFGQLIASYEKLVFNVACRMLGDREDARDAAQDALVKVYKNLRRVGGVKGLKSWIYTITNNTCIDYLRKRKNKSALSLDAMIETDDGAMERQIPSDEPVPEAILEKKERARQIQAAINRLKPEHKTLIVLRDVQGLTYEEIAAVTLTELGTVKSRLSRARLKLRSILIEIMEQNKP